MDDDKSIPEHVDNFQDFLKILRSKPTNITEKEVSFYREQKICIVCKNKAFGHIFIHSCDALYCLKCADALIQIDNLCWVCENAIDDTKPIKIVERIEEDIAYILQEEFENELKKKNESK